MSSLPFLLLLAIFVGAAAATWIAGIQLSRLTDILAERLHLGQALGGVVVLAISTNLPELAITISAAIQGDLSIAVGNILGGIALQTVVLAILDLVGVRGPKSLTYRAASLALIVEAALVIAILAVVVGGTQLPSNVVFLRLTPDAVLIAILWFVGLALVNRAGQGMSWDNNGQAPDSQPEPSGHSRKMREAAASRAGLGTARVLAVFGAAALVTLVGGMALEFSGSAMAGDLGLSGVVFGATVLALATSLPEISTGLAAVRAGDYKLAVSDIFGGNAFLPVLFLVATVISGKAVLPNAQTTDVYLTALAILLTLVYLLDWSFDRDARFWGWNRLRAGPRLLRRWN